MNKKIPYLAIGIIAGASITSGLYHLNLLGSDSAITDEASGEKVPLYWVAPMDDNYRRDKPGKSPMGMDLVPVYEESSASDMYGPGVVTVPSHVINNLGVKTTKVEIGGFSKSVSTVGYVKYDEDKLTHIHPRVDGWIEKLYVKAAGDPIQAGQPLYTLYSPALVSAQEEYLIATKRNNKTLIEAARNRLLALQISPSFIDKLSKTKQVKQSVTFFAPQSGVVDGLKIREGFYVNPGNTLMSIAQLNQVWVEAEVFERDSGQITTGLPVSMTLDYLPGRVWQGNVDYVYPSLNATNRTLRVRLKFDNKDYVLKPNMFAQVVIDTPVITNTIVVPKQAVIRTGKQDRVVLALGDGQFKSISVSIGAVSGDKVQVLSGLTDGDMVVTSAQFLIDSESSKSSDFERMVQTQIPDSVWMEGEINAVYTDSRAANITHGPAEPWDWPEMTMDFDIAEQVDINELAAGQTLHFEVTRAEDGTYAVTGIHIMAEPSVSSASVNGVINAIDKEKRSINISRDAIEKWGRPAATLDFLIADNIDLEAFSTGDKVYFTFEVHQDFVIIDMAFSQQSQANETPEMDHRGHH